MANGFTQKIAQAFGLTDVSSTGSAGSNGQPDPTLGGTYTIEINKDSGVAGVLIVGRRFTPGSAQQATGAAVAWIIHREGAAVASAGGTLQKADGTSFASAGLPTAAAIYKNVIAHCTDGIFKCKNDGSAWVATNAAS